LFDAGAHVGAEVAMGDRPHGVSGKVGAQEPVVPLAVPAHMPAMLPQDEVLDVMTDTARKPKLLRLLIGRRCLD
jgi:hypothetical protein